jgi:DNA repair exonuclease SbcCD ATPase subunit
MIVFKRLTFQNFLSVGNAPVTINLNETKTTLIHGTNGSGKSTILDVLCYALFNKPFRRVNLPQLVNTQNKKNLLTEVEFTIGRNTYIVRRGSKPKVFMILKNGEPLMAKAADKDNQQHLEQNILKLTYKSFCQVVILGSSNYIPFMQLPTAGRRECVEDFLDIKVFSTMSVIAKERLRSLKDQQDMMEMDISNLGYKCDLQRDRIRELEKQSDTNIQEIKSLIDERTEKVEHLESTIKRTQEHEKSVIELAQQELRNNPQSKLKKLNELYAKMESKMDRINKDSQFYKENDECPTCQQHITDDTKSNIITKNDEELVTLRDACGQLVEQQEEYEHVLKVATQRQKHVQSLQNSIFKYQTEVDTHQLEISRLNKKLSDLMNDTASIDKETGKFEVMEQDLNQSREKLFELQGRIQEHELVNNLLKDNGIKTQIVKKYLPVMNNLIRKNMVDLDLPIHFVLDEEFSESVSSPLHQNFSYASFSEGQKARIDLSLMFTWREIGKIKNSVSTNLLILDEVFSSSLDDTGKDLLFKLLRYEMDDNQNILVVDHTLSSSFKDKFDRAIEVTRNRGFSSYN